LLRKFLLLAVLLPVFALISVGTASADSKYTTRTLAKVLLTQDEVNTMLKDQKSDLRITDFIDIDPSDDPVSVGRVYRGNDDQIIDISLFSPKSGAVFTDSQHDKLLSADTARQFADSTFTKIKDFDAFGDILGDDFGASFTGTYNGEIYNVAEVIFVKGNVYGLVLYATTGDPEGRDLGRIYGTQLNKLEGN